jgi:hypothetical protein
MKSIERLRSFIQREFGTAKYELTGNVTKVQYTGLLGTQEIELRQIKALRDIPEAGVKVGDFGGFVQGHGNLSHRGSAWVGDQATVWDGALVTKSGLVTDSANVVGVQVKGAVTGHSEIYGYLGICDVPEGSKVNDRILVVSPSGPYSNKITETAALPQRVDHQPQVRNVSSLRT